MKNFGKFFVLCFFFSIIATILIACGPNIRASDFTNFNGTVINNPQDDTVQDDTVTNPNENAEKPTDIIETPKDKNDEPKQTQTEECEHEFSAWEITTKPTCTQPGVKSRHCLHCEKVETEEIAPAHQYTLYTQEPTCTQDGYEVQKCEKCGHIDESTKVILPATGHHEFDEHTHRCKHCQEFEPPINNLAGSYWYLTANDNSLDAHQDSWAIFFEKDKMEYYAHKIELQDGKWVKSEENKIKYNGKYDIISFDNEYFIHLDDKLCANGNIGFGKDFYLLYDSTKKDANNNTLFTLTADSYFGETKPILFINKYQNCTLIFAGYEL